MLRWRVSPAGLEPAALKPAAVDRVRRPMAISGGGPSGQSKQRRLDEPGRIARPRPALPAMAGRPSLNARSLEALGAARLAELLLLHTEGNAAARRALRLALAEARGPLEMAQEVRKRLASLERSERWLDRRARAPVLAELDSQRQAIATAIGSQAPALAVELLWRLLELAPSLLDRIDDSDDAGLALFHRASADLGALAGQARLPLAALVEQVAEAVLSNSHGQYDHLVRDLVGALKPEGLALLQQQLERQRPAPCRPHTLLEEDEPEEGEEEGVLVPAADTPDGHGGHDDFAWDGEEDDEDQDSDGWIGSFEPDDDDGDDHLAMDPWRQRQDVRRALLAIADGLGDAEAYLAEYRDHAPAALGRPRLVARMARRLTDVGQPERALALLQAVELAEGLGSDGARPWLDAQLLALDALGRDEEAQVLRRRFALERLSLPHLRAYLQRLPAFEDAEAEEELLEAVLEHPLFDPALDFLHRWPDPRRAARLIESHPEQLNGAHEPLLSAVAASLETRQPLAASLCLRAMIEEVLDMAQTSRYPRAVRQLESCRRLASAIDDWGRFPPHNAYVRGLLWAFGHLMGFMKRLDLDALLLPE